MKNFFTAFYLLIAFNSNAQECGTPITTTNQVFNIPTDNDAQYCVNVKFHIVRESNGAGGFDASQIPSLINYINQFYNSISINVTSAGFDYINNSALFNIDDAGNNSTEFNQLITNNNVSNSINFYIVNSANYNGRAGAIISNNLVVRLDKVFAPTSPHEIGHCFNLLHTFQGTASGTGGCAENINGSNCSSCGDNVCDTPADANVGATSGYNPDLTNIMSYYSTRDHFTQLQGTRMRNAIGGSSILQQTLSSQCASITGPKIICVNSNYQYTFNNPQNISVTWSVSTNIQIVNSSNIGLTIKSTNSNINGQATITANINGTLVTKVVWIGKPKVQIYQPPTSTCNSVLQIRSAISNVSLSDQGIDLGSITWSRDGEQSVGFRNYNFGGYYTPITLNATNTCGTTTYASFIPLRLPARCGPSPISRTSNLVKDNSTLFRIFPNPSFDFINIELKTENLNKKNENKIFGELFDLFGQSRLKVEIIGNKASFSVYGLNKGIYVLKILLNNQIENHQIIVE